jgi:hypothetical protein
MIEKDHGKDDCGNIFGPECGPRCIGRTEVKFRLFLSGLVASEGEWFFPSGRSAADLTASV